MKDETLYFFIKIWQLFKEALNLTFLTSTMSLKTSFSMRNFYILLKLWKVSYFLRISFFLCVLCSQMSSHLTPDININNVFKNDSFWWKLKFKLIVISTFNWCHWKFDPALCNEKANKLSIAPSQYQATMCIDTYLILFCMWYFNEVNVSYNWKD